MSDEPEVVPTAEPPIQQETSYLQVNPPDGRVVGTLTYPHPLHSNEIPPDGSLVEATQAQLDAIAQPGIHYLETDGTIRTEPIVPPVQFDATATVKAQVRTTDDVAMEVFRFACSAKHRYEARMVISGIDAGNFASKVMEGRFVWKMATTAAAVTGITVVSDIHDTAAASWAPNCLPSGADVVFTVKGAAGRTIDWLLKGEVDVFAPEGLGG
jgi:hypothetical protein